MKALSIRQPWAWLIVYGGKDIENRTWPTKFRGEFLIHASKGMTHNEYEEVIETLAYKRKFGNLIDKLPRFDELERGGIIGRAEIVDCVTQSNSPWFFGTYGFVLKNARPISFTPAKGSLGFFNVEL